MYFGWDQLQSLGWLHSSLQHSHSPTSLRMDYFQVVRDSNFRHHKYYTLFQNSSAYKSQSIGRQPHTLFFSFLPSFPQQIQQPFILMERFCTDRLDNKPVKTNFNSLSKINGITPFYGSREVAGKLRSIRNSTDHSRPLQKAGKSRIAHKVEELAFNRNTLPDVRARFLLHDTDNFNFEDQFIKDRYVQSAKNTIILDSLLKILTHDEEGGFFPKSRPSIKIKTEEHKSSEFFQKTKSPLPKKGPKIIENDITSKMKLKEAPKRKLFSEERPRNKIFDSHSETTNKAQFTFYRNEGSCKQRQDTLCNKDSLIDTQAINNIVFATKPRVNGLGVSPPRRLPITSVEIEDNEFLK